MNCDRCPKIPKDCERCKLGEMRRGKRRGDSETGSFTKQDAEQVMLITAWQSGALTDEEIEQLVKQARSKGIS